MTAGSRSSSAACPSSMSTSHDSPPLACAPSASVRRRGGAYGMRDQSFSAPRTTSTADAPCPTTSAPSISGRGAVQMLIDESPFKRQGEIGEPDGALCGRRARCAVRVADGVLTPRRPAAAGSRSSCAWPGRAGTSGGHHPFGYRCGWACDGVDRARAVAPAPAVRAGSPRPSVPAAPPPAAGRPPAAAGPRWPAGRARSDRPDGR